MKKKERSKKQEYKISYKLNIVTSVLFAMSAVMCFISGGNNTFQGITFTGLCITFGSIAYLNYQNYKNEK